MFSVRDVSHKFANKGNGKLIELSESQIQQIQNITIDIYKDIMEACEKHGLYAILGGGSALGAVRHHGFIPWDDDMDLMMSRQDFNKFMRIFNVELGEKYYLACPDYHYSDHHIYIAKVIDKNSLRKDFFNLSKFLYEGISIDIGAIDSVPDNPLLYYCKGCFSILLLFITNSNMMYHCRTKISDFVFTRTIGSSFYYYSRMFLGFLSSVIPYKRWCFIFDKFIASHAQTNRLSIPSGRNHYFKETQPVGVFYPLKKIMFEGISSYVPNDVDEYLSRLYGNNYMVIPPEDKREKHLLTEFTILSHKN